MTRLPGARARTWPRLWRKASVWMVAVVGRDMCRILVGPVRIEVCVLETVADVVVEVFAVRARRHQAGVDRRRHVEIAVHLAADEFDFKHSPVRVVADAKQGFRIDRKST